MQKEVFDVFCLTCNLLVEAKAIARGFGEYRSNVLNPPDEIDVEYHGDHYSVALCRQCNGPFLVREALYGVPSKGCLTRLPARWSKRIGPTPRLRTMRAPSCVAARWESFAGLC